MYRYSLLQDVGGRQRERERQRGGGGGEGEEDYFGGGGMGIIRTQQYFQKGTACFRKFS